MTSPGHGAPSAIERSEEREDRTPMYRTQCVLPLALLSDTGTLVLSDMGVVRWTVAPVFN